MDGVALNGEKAAVPIRSGVPSPRTTFKPGAVASSESDSTVSTTGGCVLSCLSFSAFSDGFDMANVFVVGIGIEERTPPVLPFTLSLSLSLSSDRSIDQTNERTPVWRAQCRLVLLFLIERLLQENPDSLVLFAQQSAILACFFPVIAPIGIIHIFEPKFDKTKCSF